MPQLVRDTDWPIVTQVSKQTIYNGLVYIVGQFTDVAGQTTYRIAALDPITSRPLPMGWGFNTYGSITLITIVRGVVYFSPANEGKVYACSLATGEQIQGFDSPLMTHPVQVVLSSLVSDGTYLYVGGQFTQANGLSHNGLVVLSLADGSLVQSWDAGADSAVLGITIDGDDLYIAGSFSNVAGSPRTCVAKMDKTTGVLDASWAPSITGSSPYVNQILATAGVLYLVGRFDLVDGDSRRNAVAVSKPDATVFAWDANITDGVNVFGAAVSPTGNILLVGDFNAAAGQTRGGLVEVDPFTGALTDSSVPFTASYFDGIDSVLTLGLSIYLTAGFFSGPPVGWSEHSRYMYPPIPDPPTGTPQKPKLTFLLRKNGVSLFKWEPVTKDVYLNDITPEGYRVYRSSNTNLESYVAIKDITTLDALGAVDTMFAEPIEGFYGYAVTAFVGNRESEKRQAKIVNSAFDGDLF